MHKELLDLRVTMRVLGWLTTNAVLGLWISLSSFRPDDFTLASRISRQLLMVAARSGLPAGETFSDHRFGVAESRKCRQIGEWPLRVCDQCALGHSQRRRVRVRRMHCGRPDWASIQCRSRRGICAFSGRRHKRAHGPRQRISNGLFAKFVADSLRQAIMLIAVARLTALSSTRLKMGVGKRHCDGVLPGSSCTSFRC